MVLIVEMQRCLVKFVTILNTVPADGLIFLWCKNLTDLLNAWRLYIVANVLRCYVSLGLFRFYEIQYVKLLNLFH